MRDGLDPLASRAPAPNLRTFQTARHISGWWDRLCGDALNDKSFGLLSYRAGLAYRAYASELPKRNLRTHAERTANPRAAKSDGPSKPSSSRRSRWATRPIRESLLSPSHDGLDGYERRGVCTWGGGRLRRTRQLVGASCRVAEGGETSHWRWSPPPHVRTPRLPLTWTEYPNENHKPSKPERTPQRSVPKAGRQATGVGALHPMYGPRACRDTWTEYPNPNRTPNGQRKNANE